MSTAAESIGRSQKNRSSSKEFTAGNTNPHCCHMGTAIKHPMLDGVKPLFVIFDILAL